MPAGGPELQAMQATLRRHPEVVAGLGRLDAAYPDAEAIRGLARRCPMRCSRRGCPTTWTRRR